MGFGADLVALSTDTWMTTTLTHPETGKPREPSEINIYAQAHPEKASDLFKEMLLTMVMNRAGDSAHVVQAYRTYPSPLQKGRTLIEWLDWQPPMDGDVQMDGYIPDALRSVMEEPTVDVIVAREGYPVGEVNQWRDHADLATVRSAQQKIGDDVRIMLFAEPGSDRQKLFRTRLGPGQIIEPPELGEWAD